MGQQPTSAQPYPHPYPQIAPSSPSSPLMDPKTQPGPKPKHNKKPPTSEPFQFCHVCRLNHDQGHRHKYFASHLRSLSSFLSRFLKKLAEVRLFLQSPTTSAAPGRLWCVFCGVDVIDLESDFACGKVIYHLASAEHLERVKGFLRDNGGGMDRVDSFRVSDSELIKWEKGCKSLKSAPSSSSKGHIWRPPGPAKDIQHEISAKNMYNFDNHSISCFNSNNYNAVVPLQNLTNEGYRLHPPAVNGGAAYAGSIPYNAAALSVGLQEHTSFQDLPARELTPIKSKGKQPMLISNNGNYIAGQHQTNGLEHQRNVSGEDCTKVFQTPSQISFSSEGSQANVHTGALPPWLEAGEENEVHQLTKKPPLNKHTTPAQTAKTKKLNPKRVGAAWAEKRRIELEMEKRGEIIPSTVDANWLPNFGRVWQTGTRKESRKEFEIEKRKLPKDEKQPEVSFKMQPYISKRMRTGSPSREGAANDHAEEIADTSQQ